MVAWPWWMMRGKPLVRVTSKAGDEGLHCNTLGPAKQKTGTTPMLGSIVLLAIDKGFEYCLWMRVAMC